MKTQEMQMESTQLHHDTETNHPPKNGNQGCDPCGHPSEMKWEAMIYL